MRTVRQLLEGKKAGVITIESEYAKYDQLGGYPPPGGLLSNESDGWYLLGGYIGGRRRPKWDVALPQ